MSVDPGEGWRLLSRGEIKVAGDEFLYFGEWRQCHYIGKRHDGGVARRRIKSAVVVHTGGPYIAIEVHREAIKEINRLQLELLDTRRWWDKEVKLLKAELDAAKKPQPDPEPEWFDLTPFGEHVLREHIDFVLCYVRLKWEPVSGIAEQTVRDSKEDGYTQFRCLLKDAPPELVAKTESCVMCGTRDVVPGTDGCLDCTRYAIETTGCHVESPDDWVTQDRVPIRVGIDEFRWGRNNFELAREADNFTSRAVHGWGSLEVRCRRRDLPPLPQQPKTEREVLLFWYDGNVVGRYADCPPTDPSFVPLIMRDGKVFIELETREVVR